MSRTVRSIACHFMLGACLSLLVSLGCGTWSRVHEVAFDGDTAGLLFTSRYPDAGVPFRYEARRERGFGREIRKVVATEADDPARYTVINHVRHGWPLSVLEGEHHFGAHVERRGLRGAVVPPDWIRRSERMVGVTPRPGPLVVSAALYGGAMSLVLILPGAVRGAIRRRRGRCAGCGYRAGGGAVCPECGAPARRRPRPA